MQVMLDTGSIESYKMFLAIKQLPRYSIRGHLAEFPDEYASAVGLPADAPAESVYEPPPWMFDYQAAISRMVVRKQKFAVFADCGLGKTGILLEFARHAAASIPRSQCVLIVSPLMVLEQTVAEAKRWYGDAMPIDSVPAHDLQSWLNDGRGKVGITNYEAIRDGIRPGRLGGLALDESSMLKSHYGKWGTRLLSLGRGLRWKSCYTGTPAPNDRIEYANHAVFLDQFPTVNAFLARYFVNRGQTQERWVLKPHAMEPFYRSLSHWSIFLTNPATYGWKDNTATIPPIKIHQHHVDLTREQEELVYKQTGSLFANDIGGIASRASLAGIAKGWKSGKAVPTHKYRVIRDLVESWPDESTIIWCLYNNEQDYLEETFPDAASIRGETPHEKRMAMIDDFKAGRVRVLISKPKILGFGLNLQIATRQVFSGLQDSYESFYQAVKRSNRYGSTVPLNVHIPITDIEAPMVDTVLRKAKMVQADTEAQERIFRNASIEQ